VPLTFAGGLGELFSRLLEKHNMRTDKKGNLLFRSIIPFCWHSFRPIGPTRAAKRFGCQTFARILERWLSRKGLAPGEDYLTHGKIFTLTVFAQSFSPFRRSESLFASGNFRRNRNLFFMKQARAITHAPKKNSPRMKYFSNKSSSGRSINGRESSLSPMFSIYNK
jgi:hypothetical protein